jgi:acetyl-CoA synthetase
VADVAVVGAPDPVFGQVVVAHVVRRMPAPAEREPTRVVAAEDWESTFLAWAAERLAPHQRPRQVVLHAELPRNETGKVLRRILMDA